MSDRTAPGAASGAGLPVSLEGVSVPALGARFEDALRYAALLHAGQVRKGTAIPYVAHLLGVTSLVLEHGGDEDQAIAALLHDAVEDQGGLERLRAIRGRFGDRVARIVLACTDAIVEPKPEWRARKEAYIARLRREESEALLVSAADKLHNARAILADCRRDGPATMDRFSGGLEGTGWYYESVVAVYEERLPDLPLVAELRRVVDELCALLRPREPSADQRPR